MSYSKNLKDNQWFTSSFQTHLISAVNFTFFFSPFICIYLLYKYIFWRNKYLAHKLHDKFSNIKYVLSLRMNISVFVPDRNRFIYEIAVSNVVFHWDLFELLSQSCLQINMLPKKIYIQSFFRMRLPFFLTEIQNIRKWI